MWYRWIPFDEFFHIRREIGHTHSFESLEGDRWVCYVLEVGLAGGLCLGDIPTIPKEDANDKIRLPPPAADKSSPHCAVVSAHNGESMCCI